MIYTRPISIRLTETDLESLDSLAETYGLGRSLVMRIILAEARESEDLGERVNTRLQELEGIV